MTDYLFDQVSVKLQLKNFFSNEKASINNFGSTVNQTFEANIFAEVIKWYRENGWTVNIVSPIINGNPAFKLKFNTRGAPENYSYAYCLKDGQSCQIRHGLRVYTQSYNTENDKSANIVCDIVIMADENIDHFSSDTALSNECLIAFGEVKHMSAYAELIASFIGLVHELQPERLKKIRVKKWKRGDTISSFLYVSGILYRTAEGLAETIEKRKYDIDVYSFSNPMNENHSV
ncbi:MAG: hypothetical protein AB2L20_29010 [Mangrovibacterium sp.]